jgi:E3 ubiquitin-protein ligase UBR7
MFQCVGLGPVEEGGCGEDWWHAECIVGMPRGWYKKDTMKKAEKEAPARNNGDMTAADSTVDGAAVVPEEDAEMNDVVDDDPPLPPGFPQEDDFDAFVCYKCVEAFPWIKRYAGTEGFLPAVFHQVETKQAPTTSSAPSASVEKRDAPPASVSESRKRKASEEPTEANTEATISATAASKRQRTLSEDAQNLESKDSLAPSNCVYDSLPQAATGTISIFLTSTFRDHLCKCRTHFPLLTPHPALLDEEEVYEPPVSESSPSHHGGSGSLGSRSLLDMGEAALSNVDRVRAIEGVMVYNHLKDKVKGFLKPFADSGVPVGAEDIKRYFEQLRGEGEVMKEMRSKTGAEGSGGEGDSRREQGGY